MRINTLLGLAVAVMAMGLPSLGQAQTNDNTYDLCFETCHKTVDTPLPGPCDAITADAPTVPMMGGTTCGAPPIGNWDVCTWLKAGPNWLPVPGSPAANTIYQGSSSDTSCADIGNCATGYFTNLLGGSSFTFNTSVISVANNVPGGGSGVAFQCRVGDTFFVVGRDTSSAYGGNGNDVVSGEPLFDPANGVLYNTTDPAFMNPSGGPMSCRMWLWDTIIVQSVPDTKDRHCGVAGQRNMVFSDHSVAIGIKDVPTVVVPREFALEQNYPNPFNPTTNIKFTVPTTAKVTLSVTNALGQVVKTLVNEEKGTGSYEATWDATNDRGDKVVSGVYFYNMTAGSFSAKRRMVLQK